MADVRKIASLAMLEPSGQQLVRLQRDVGEILEMGQTMPSRCAAQEVAGVSADTLRSDTAEVYADPAGLIALSEKARDGYIVVPRTVGGEV